MDNIEKKELLVKPKVKVEHLDKYYSKEFLKTYFK